MPMTFQERLRSRLEEDPEARCLAFVDRRGGFTWRSRREVGERVAGGAAWLVSRGTRPGDVCLSVAVDPEACAYAVLATLVAGGVPLLVAPPAIQGVNSSLAEILGDVARRAEPRLALLAPGMEAVARRLAESASELRCEVGFEALLGAPPARLGVVERGDDDVVALQLTSGTTGFPRIAVWKQRSLLAALDGMHAGMGVARDDVQLNWTPLYHDMGLVNNLLFCVAHGLPLALLSPLDVVRDPALWLRALDATGATTTWSPNFGYALAAERVEPGALDGVDLSRVRGFWNAAERVHLETLRRFHGRFEDAGVRWEALRTNFGCVETVGGATFTAPGEAVVAEPVDLERLQKERRAHAPADEDPTTWIVGCGRPHPGLELAILGPDGAPLPDGEVGEVALRGEGRFDGYLGDPQATSAVCRSGWVLPGDLGYVRGGELFWTGRSDERIKLQGRSFDPSELERVLFEVDGLRKGCFAAFGKGDVERGTEALVVLAEVADDEIDPAPLARRVRAAVASGLGITIDELALVPRSTLTKTSSGKRRHRHFGALYRAGALDVLHRSGAGSL